MKTNEFIRFDVPLGERTLWATDFAYKPTLGGSGPTNFSAPMFLPRAVGPAGFDTAKIAIAPRNLLMLYFIIKSPFH